MCLGVSDEKKSARMKNNVNTNSRLRRDCSVVDVHDEKFSILKILLRKSRQDTFQTCERKSCTSCVTDISGDFPNNDMTRRV